MKAAIYTITSDNYYYKFTEKSLKSFIISCGDSGIKYYVLSPHEIEDKIDNENIVYVNMEKLIPENVRSLGVKTACKWLKTQIGNVIKLDELDWLIYSDSDVLYFRDITPILENKDPNMIHLSYDSARGRFQNLERNKYRFCSGFMIFSPSQFPHLLHEWKARVEVRMVDKPKLLDQPCLIDLLKEQYPDNCKSILLDEVSYKGRRENCYVTHYINRKKHRFDSGFEWLENGKQEKTS